MLGSVIGDIKEDTRSLDSSSYKGSSKTSAVG